MRRAASIAVRFALQAAVWPVDREQLAAVPAQSEGQQAARLVQQVERAAALAPGRQAEA
jgi:hypothetical protein